VSILFFLVSLIADEPVILLPKNSRPDPIPVKPAQVDTMDVEQIFLVQSSQPLVIDVIPDGIIEIEEVPKGTIVRSRFAGGGLKAERRSIDQEFGYLIEGMALGEVTIIMRPEPATRKSSVQKVVIRVVDVVDEKENIPTPVVKKDEIDLIFEADKRVWRETQKGLAARLDSGEIDSEEEATKWFAATYGDSRRKNWLPLLVKEKDVFGAEKWTAADHSKYIKRYFDAAP